MQGINFSDHESAWYMNARVYMCSKYLTVLSILPVQDNYDIIARSTQISTSAIKVDNTLSSTLDSSQYETINLVSLCQYMCTLAV